MTRSIKVFALISGLIILSNNLLAEDSIRSFGNVKVHEQTYDKVSVNGNFTANKITVINSTSINGNCNITKSTLNRVSIHGKSEFDRVTVNDSISTSGNFILKKSTINGSNLSISGDFMPTKNTIQSKLNLSGNLISQYNTYTQPLNISGEIHSDSDKIYADITTSAAKIQLIKTRVKGNIINTNDSKATTPEIIIDGSQIIGNVTFDKSKGVVILKNGGKVTGKIINAVTK